MFEQIRKNGEFSLLFWNKKKYLQILGGLIPSFFRYSGIFDRGCFILRRENVQEMMNVKLWKQIFSLIQKMWWHEYVWMKTCPPEVFSTPYHTHKPIIRKKHLHFRDLVKKWRFFTNFLPSTKIFACLVNKCWPKFYHEKKALIFFYTTLTLDFSYLS